MKSKEQGKFIVIAAAVMFAALLLAAPVFADGEAPPEEPLAQDSAETTEAPPQEETLPEEELASLEAVEELPTQEENITPPATVEPSAEGAEAEPIPATEEITADETGADETAAVVEALAEADLALSDETGKTVNMASGDTAAVLAAPDPYYKVGTTTYRFFESATGCDAYPGEEAAGTCFDGEANPIQAAIDYVPISGLPTDRKIYVETGTYTGGAAFDATTEPLLAQLNGLIGIYNPDTETRPIITGDVVLDQNIGGFTLSGFTIINGYFGSYDGAGTLVLDDIGVTSTSGVGIIISHHDGNIEVKNTTTSGNHQGGADIDNGDPGNKFSVTIKNSVFDKNGINFGNVYGLDINTLGKVTIENVSVSRNRGAGINLNTDFSGLTVKNAVLMSNDANPDNPSLGFGLYANSTQKANITLDMVTASDNKGSGNAIFLGTAGTVTVNNTIAYGNTGWGLSINNTAGSGGVRVTNSKLINNNGGSGLTINSLGPVYLSSIDASQNNSNGAFISTQNNVTITSDRKLGYLGANDFSSNGEYGLYISTTKAIAITNIIANGNTNTNIHLDNTAGTAGITIKKTLPSTQYDTFYNSASGSTSGDGLYIRSHGAVQVEYLTANDNNYDGIDISNQSSTQSPGIKILYAEAHENQWHGLHLQSKGSVTLTNTSANKNGSAGAYNGLKIDTLSGSSGGVTISGINGYISTFNENARYGIFMDVLGNVSLKNVEANLNTLPTYIANHTASSPKTVKVVNMIASGITNSSGLEIYSKGTITLDNITANGNSTNGAVLRNTYGTGSVSIKNSVFTGNQAETGLLVNSFKNIALSNVQAFNNNSFGAYLDNCQYSGSACVGTGSVTISAAKNAYNIFAGNGNTGLQITSKGNVSISNIIATENGSSGLNIYHAFDASSGNVTISSGSNMRNLFSNNASHGIYLSSKGNVSISNTDVFASQAGGGAFIDNRNALSAKTVKVKDSTFLRNENYGLYIDANGTVTLQGVDASDNSIYNGTLTLAGSGRQDVLSAAYEHDTYTFTGASVGDPYAITLESLFFDVHLELRGPDGALVDSDTGSGGAGAAISGTLPAAGDYTIHVMSADGYGSGTYLLSLNGGGYSQSSYRGVYINNTYGNGAVKILYSSKMGYGLRAWNNTYDGVRVLSNGAVAIDRAEVMYNGAAGITITNDHANEQTVTLKNSTLQGMPSTGINITSRGNVSLSKVTSTFNRSTNLIVYNDTADKERWVKVASSTFSGAIESDNIYLSSKGTVTLTNIESEYAQGANTNGIVIYNTAGNGNVIFNGSRNAFNNNNGDGIYIESHGDISLTNVIASDNGNRGIYARNAYTSFTPKNITLNASGGKTMATLHNNGNYNFFFVSHGMVSVNKAESVGAAFGSYIQNASGPDTKKVSVSNSVFKESGDDGLEIIANGAVNLTNIWASDNGDFGIRVENTAATGEDVIIKSATVNDNADHGLFILSDGLIKVDRATAYRNNGYGIYLNNNNGNEGIQVLNSTAAQNAQAGVYLASRGTLSIKNVNTISNLGDGIFVNGANSGASVTLSNVYSAMNQHDGIDLFNVGSVSISGTTAAVNGTLDSDNDGLRIDSNGSGVVTLSKSTFIGNYGNGVELSDVASFTQTNTVIIANDVDGDGDDDLYQH